jgi:DNA-binding response OmpR family regulator
MHSPTILIVEDDAATREFYEVLLLSKGYNVLLASSGGAALIHADTQPIQGVLLDRRLPDMDGVQVCRQLRQKLGATVPIIMVTADRDSSLEANVRAVGATDLLSKPFEPDVLLQKLAADLPV